MTRKNRYSVYFDREKGQFVGLTDEIKQSLYDTYKSVNVEFELKKMILWMQSPRGLKTVGTLEFITNWLGKAKPYYSKELAGQLPEIDEFLFTHLSEYLQDLWKDRQHILDMNTKKR